MKSKILKFACYGSSFTMAVVANLPPLLFLIFRDAFDVSYSLLGLLVLINFSTQLSVDLIFSAFSRRLSVPVLVRAMPMLVLLGLFIFATVPILFPSFAYLGLLVGTVIFSAGSGLSEVLVSPIIASIPADNPEREMSKLHSVYAWGVVFVIIVSTVAIRLFGEGIWYVITLAFMPLPLVSGILFFTTDIPDLSMEGDGEPKPLPIRERKLWLCVFAIFLGGAVECNMAQWASSYLEASLGIEKALGDIFGVAGFAMMLGIGRSLYAKRGVNVERILFYSALGATVCYLVAALTTVSVIGLVACAMTGLFSAMLWPGTLIVVAKYFKEGGVFIYALMAAGGDLGASVAPQLTGIIADYVSTLEVSVRLAERLGVSVEAVGIRCGIFVGALFAMAAIFVFYRIYKRSRS